MSSKVLSRKPQESQQGPGMYFKPIFNQFQTPFWLPIEVAGRTAGREGEVRDVWDIYKPWIKKPNIRVYLASDFLFKHLELRHILDSIDKKVISYHKPQPYFLFFERFISRGRV